MFRRLPVGLPEDPTFPVGLDALGYYVNEIDEVRSKLNPRAYFHYFLTKNERYNDIQREAMNESLRQIFMERLEDLGLEKVRLPIGAGPNDRHIPILVSKNIKTATRVVVVFHDTFNDLGVFAYRIIGGPRGVNAGSAVDLVKHIQSQASGPDDPNPPGIILGNPGQLYWHRKTKRAMTSFSWSALPMKSAVDQPFRFDEIKNRVPGHKDSAAHVASVLCDVDELANPKATIDIIGVTSTANNIVEFLDKPENFAKFGPRIGGIALLQPYYWSEEVKSKELGEFLKRCGRAFLSGQEVEAGKVVCGPHGMKDQRGFLAPLYSLGQDALVVECLLPLNHKLITDWFQEIAMGGKDYANPEDYEVGKEPLAEEPEEEEEVVIDPEWVPVVPIKEHPGLGGRVDD